MFRLRAQLLGKFRFIGSFRSVKAPYSLFLITESWNWRVFFLNCYLRVIWCTYNTENLTFSLPFAKTIWPSPGTIEFDLNTQRRFGLYADVLPCFLFFCFFQFLYLRISDQLMDGLIECKKKNQWIKRASSKRIFISGHLLAGE